MGVAGEEFDSFYAAMNLAVSAARRAGRRTVALGRLGPQPNRERDKDRRPRRLRQDDGSGAGRVWVGNFGPRRRGRAPAR